MKVMDMSMDREIKLIVSLVLHSVTELLVWMMDKYINILHTESIKFNVKHHSFNSQWLLILHRSSMSSIDFRSG